VKHSAGVLLYRRTPALQVLLVHPGGPYWQNKDRGVWQIPQGEIEPGEDPETAARREIEEELGVALSVTLRPLGEIRQAGGKLVTAFAAEQDLDPAMIRSNTFEIEWPPRSGRLQSFPEVSAARWLTVAEAGRIMLPSQLPLLGRLAALVN
jgi:predicted NUDIX family NTP pyrophosphohydrolase